VPEVSVLDGAAEAMPLPDGGADVVVVGQAFHWFHGEMAAQEIARVLHPRGRLGLVWNLRDESEAWVAAVTRVLESHRGDAPRYADGTWRQALDRSDRFTALRHAAFGHVHTADVATMLDRFASVSFVAAADEQTRTRLLDELREILEELADPSTRLIAMPYRTDVYWCQVAD
jgi:SAM-dependent methyltransferase